jgi:hypothetical protein
MAARHASLSGSYHVEVKRLGVHAEHHDVRISHRRGSTVATEAKEAEPSPPSLIDGHQTVQQAVECALRKTGPQDFIELVATVSITPDRVRQALQELVDAGRVQVVDESESTGVVIYRTAA